MTQLEWVATIEQTIPPATPTSAPPPPVQVKKPFKVTTKCVVQSIVTQAITPINFDIGIGTAVSANLPPFTVTPTFCKPLVQLQWTRDSTQPFVTVDSALKKILVSTTDTGVMGMHPIMLKATVQPNPVVVFATTVPQSLL